MGKSRPQQRQKRADQINQGAYDGRYRERTVPMKTVYSRKNFKITFE